MLDLELATQFKRDLKKIGKQQKNKEIMDYIVEQLQREQPLHPKHKDHNLTGNWYGYRECQRVSGKGNITCVANFMAKLKSLYGARFNDNLCFADSNITVN